MNTIQLLQQVKAVAPAINTATNALRQQLMTDLAAALENHAAAILEANALDLARMDATNPMADRLKLSDARIKDIADAIRQLSALPDPVGKQLSAHRHPKGFTINKLTVPLGVVGAIFESRPNVTADIAALCLRSGNAAVLKGGSDAAESNLAIVAVIAETLKKHGLPEALVTLLPNDRESTAKLLNATRQVDVLVPRGSQGLIDFVRKNATIPVIETGAGVCHTYVHEEAGIPMAIDIVVNAKTQRPSVCNALDTVLIDKAIAEKILPLLAEKLSPFAVGIYADGASFSTLNKAGYPHLHPASPEDFGREFLSLNCSIKLVEDVDEALQHIAQYSSRHSECIVTENQAVADRFLREVDAAAVYHNVSTRFTDGGEFGLGAELGISTQKLHARGPFALEKLVCEKWVVQGNGQTR